MAFILWPTVDEVAAALRHCQAAVPVGEGLDVRLQVKDDSTWRLWAGDPLHDTDSDGYWGSDWLTADDSADCSDEEQRPAERPGTRKATRKAMEQTPKRPPARGRALRRADRKDGVDEAT